MRTDPHLSKPSTASVDWLEDATQSLQTHGLPTSELLLELHDDALGFAERCIAWGPDDDLADYQAEALDRVVADTRLSVRSPNGAGKTAVAAIATLWFALTREAAREDWKVITTAGVWRQLTAYLWPEIHKWARQLRWDLIGRAPLAADRELQRLRIRLRYGEALAVASREPALIEGAHAQQLLYIFDEAKAIPPDIWGAAEGAFAGAGPDTDATALALAISTPGEPAGTFYEIQERRAGTEDWSTMKISQEDAIRSGRMSAEWAERRRMQWGEASALYLNRVMGEFASTAADSVIPLAWVEAANERWQEDGVEVGGLTHLGVDVAGMGVDKTVLARRHGDFIAELERHQGLTTTEVTGLILPVLEANEGVVAIIDVIGIGAGVVDQTRDEGHEVDGFNAAGKTDAMDVSGEMGFANRRSAAWWNLRELLDPAFGSTVALPPDDMLIGDLTAPRWRVTTQGKIQVESKDDIAKRLGRSTDDGDAVVQAFAGPAIEVPDTFSVGAEAWESCLDPLPLVPGEETDILVGGIHASPEGATVAIQVVSRIAGAAGHVAQRYAEFWTDDWTEDDLWVYLGDLSAEFKIRQWAYDQEGLLAAGATRAMPKMGVWFRPYPRGAQRANADAGLYNLIRERRLHHLGDDATGAQALAAVIRTDQKRGARMQFTRGPRGDPLDSLAALAMAAAECQRLNI